MGRIPGMPNINTVEYWDRVYSEEIARKEYRDGVHERARFGAVLNYIDNGVTHSLLDYGCGTGAFIRYFSEKKLYVTPPWEIVGFDWSRIALEFNKSTDLLHTFTYQDPSGTFGAVHCGQVLEHCDDPESLVGYLWDKVEPHGILVVTVPYKDRLPDPEHVYWFDEQILNGMIGQEKRAVTFEFVSGDTRYILATARK